jgi:hypothetical protein
VAARRREMEEYPFPQVTIGSTVKRNVLEVLFHVTSHLYMQNLELLRKAFPKATRDRHRGGLFFLISLSRLATPPRRAPAPPPAPPTAPRSLAPLQLEGFASRTRSASAPTQCFEFADLPNQTPWGSVTIIDYKEKPNIEVSRVSQSIRTFNASTTRGLRMGRGG